MNSLTDLSAWRDAVLEFGSEVASTTVGLLPRVFAALVLLLFGWLLARLVEVVTSRVLRALGVDRVASRLRVTDVMKLAGLTRPISEVVSRIGFWIILLMFLLSGIELMGFGAAKNTLARLAAYVPNLVEAALVLFIGHLMARFMGSLAGSAAAAAGFANARRVGFLAQSLILGLVVVVAIEQLGVATNILVLPVTALIGAGALAAGLAFALGASPIITHILAGHFLKQSLPRESFIEIAGERGVVERVGSIDTLLRNGERSWSVPNAKLIGEVVIR